MFIDEKRGDQRRNLKLFDGDTLSYVGDCTYLIVEFIVTCHKSKFTEKYKGCQIKVLRERG